MKVKYEWVECRVKGCHRLANRVIRYHGKTIPLCSHHDLNDVFDKGMKRRIEGRRLTR
jgi:hypothetical protein